MPSHNIRARKPATLWEQQWADLLRIDHVSLRMREPGWWIVISSMKHPKADGTGFLSHFGEGRSPSGAVKDHWRQYGDGRPFWVNAISRWTRWNKMKKDWVDVPPSPA